MTIAPAKLSDPAVRAFVAAVNSHDEAAFFALLTDDATMSDDGSDRDLADWTDREIFSSHGHIEVHRETAGRPGPGRQLPQRHLGRDAHRVALHRVGGRQDQPVRDRAGITPRTAQGLALRVHSNS